MVPVRPTGYLAHGHEPHAEAISRAALPAALRLSDDRQWSIPTSSSRIFPQRGNRPALAVDGVSWLMTISQMLGS
jgi:hypothetical protein